ncbi:MAG TPA: bifunctional nuclease family protein [Thermomicrobiales bacterium]|nr:bifunctional nuclease family protein [Thermomicrobiales bacterium]
MIETVVESIRVSLVTQARVVILKEVEGERHLPIWIGPFEAEAIAMELQGIAASRPLPYDLMRSIVGELGAEVSRIVITEISNDVFYARIIVVRNGLGIEIDSRPSDAIALAVRVKAPIFVDESVMDRAGVRLEDDSEESGDEDAPVRGQGSSIPEERLSAFKDFIDTLDLDDFGTKRGN